jgi:hypothetical protein
MMKAGSSRGDSACARAESGGLALQHAENSRAQFDPIDGIERS